MYVYPNTIYNLTQLHFLVALKSHAIFVTNLILISTYSKRITHTILLYILNLLAKYIVKLAHVNFVILYINEIVKLENNNVNI